MYDLHLTAEQLEIRDTVRDFVAREIKPVALDPDRLQGSDRNFPLEILDKASQMGLRTLALSEAAGGAGADNLTSCIVAEELAAGDAGAAATLAQTSWLAHVLFDQMMTPQQRKRFLPQLLADDRYHLAFAAREPDADLAWRYHRPQASEIGVATSARRQGNGEWVLNGVHEFVANAPVAKLFAVEAATEPAASGANGVNAFVVPRDTPGLTLREPGLSAAGAGAVSVTAGHHGTGATLILENCRVPADGLVSAAGQGQPGSPGRGIPLIQAMNLGVGQAAYEAAIDYAKLRIQGGRPIIEHQAIGTLLAEIAIKLQTARSLIWQAAWASDHADAYAGRSIADLPLQTVARVFTSEAVYEATLKAAEVFGAMGVMRDMPMHKYVHDALIFVHCGTSNSVAKLQIAEAVAGYRR